MNHLSPHRRKLDSAAGNGHGGHIIDNAIPHHRHHMLVDDVQKNPLFIGMANNNVTNVHSLASVVINESHILKLLNERVKLLDIQRIVKERHLVRRLVEAERHHPRTQIQIRIPSLLVILRNVVEGRVTVNPLCHVLRCIVRPLDVVVHGRYILTDSGYWQATFFLVSLLGFSGTLHFLCVLVTEARVTNNLTDAVTMLNNGHARDIVQLVAAVAGPSGVVHGQYILTGPLTLQASCFWVSPVRYVTPMRHPAESA